MAKGKVCTLANVAEEVAKEIEVSPRTVKNAGEFAYALDVIREKAGERDGSTRRRKNETDEKRIIKR